MEVSWSASRQVFATPELVDRVLLCLLDDLTPPTNREDSRSDSVQFNARLLLHVLRCSQICSVWYRCVFYGSKALQRALFLHPEADDKRSWFQIPLVYPSQQNFYRGLAYRAPVLNPMIQTAFSGYRFRYWRSGLGADGPRHQAYVILSRRHLEYAKNYMHLGYGRTIHNMLLSQPPPTELCADIFERDPELKDFSHRTTSINNPLIQKDTGVTLADLLKRASQIFEEHSDILSLRLKTV